MPGRKMAPQEKEIKKIIAINLNRFLLQNNAKKIEISKATKIPPSTLTGYFNGTRLPTPENVDKLAKFFHVAPGDIDPRFKPVLNGTIEKSNLIEVSEKEPTVRLINNKTGREIIIPPVNIAQDKKIERKFQILLQK